jgi:hypothetical protein
MYEIQRQTPDGQVRFRAFSVFYLLYQIERNSGAFSNQIMLILGQHSNQMEVVALILRIPLPLCACGGWTHSPFQYLYVQAKAKVDLNHVF